MATEYGYKLNLTDNFANKKVSKAFDAPFETLTIQVE